MVGETSARMPSVRRRACAVLGRDEVERHGKGGVRREGFAGVVLDQLLGIAVVCCDQQATAYGERGFDDAPDARVNRFVPL